MGAGVSKCLRYGRRIHLNKQIYETKTGLSNTKKQKWNGGISIRTKRTKITKRTTGMGMRMRIAVGMGTAALNLSMYYYLQRSPSFNDIYE